MLIVLLLIITFSSLARLFILVLFILTNFLLAAGKRFLPRAIVGKYLFGVELVMFCTVMTSVAFGSVLGAVMGALLMVINYIGEKRFSQYFPVTIILYSLIGYFSYFFREYNIVLLGIALTLIYNILVNILVSFFEANRTTLLIFSLINILFNFLIFTSLGSTIKELLLQAIY